MKRPDRKELSAILASAREQIAAGATNLLTTKTFLRDLVALDWYMPADVSEGLRIVLEEIGPQHYRGERPPMLANDPACPGAELFPFVWKSNFLKREMYFKVAINSKGNVWFVSLHVSIA